MKNKLLFILLTAGIASFAVDIVPAAEKMPIVIPSKPSFIQEFAAKELQSHLQLVFNYLPEIRKGTVTDKKAFYLFPAPSDKKPLKPEEARWQIADDGRIFIYGEDLPVRGKKGIFNDLTRCSRSGSLYAVYDFLNNVLNIRHLEPGKNGIVYRKMSAVPADKKSNSWRSSLEFRELRNGIPSFSAIRRAGYPAELTLSAKKYDEWVNELNLWKIRQRLGRRSAPSYGHAFIWWWKNYGKKHPEFFALQPDGTRSQAASPDRPRLCMSNQGLVKLVAENIIKNFKKNPGKQALSVCLNDGGRARFCMCEACRKLDPPNGSPWNTTFNIKGIPTGVKYVQLTDRVIDFSNRIAAEVNKVLPGKKVCVYIYSCYSAAPAAVKPSPALVLFSTAMNYTNDKLRAASLKTLASLASFGNELFWRPNALRGFGNIAAPQNYARRMFEDTELLKFNNSPGMDFDCNEGFWSGKGLIYYTLSKAMWNPDRLSYDDIVDDYCRAGFGEAAPKIKAYFDLMEKIFDEAAAKACDYCEAYTLEKIDALEKILNDAENSTADADIKARVQFLKQGLEIGRFATKLYNAKKNKDKNYRTIQKEYRAYLQKLAVESPLAYSPGSLGFNTRFLVR